MKRINQNIILDDTDKEIIQSLSENARRSIMEIGRKTLISGAAVHQRIKKLEDAGVITGSRIEINTEALGYTTTAFIGIYLDKAAHNANAVNKLKKIPEITECYYTTGNWSVLIKIKCKDNHHLMELLSKQIQTIPGISRTETYICLNQQIDRQISL